MRGEGNVRWQIGKIGSDAIDDVGISKSSDRARIRLCEIVQVCIVRTTEYGRPRGIWRGSLRKQEQGVATARRLNAITKVGYDLIMKIFTMLANLLMSIQNPEYSPG